MNKTIKRRNWKILKLSLVMIILLIGFRNVFAQENASVSTDRQVYLLGETVNIYTIAPTGSTLEIISETESFRLFGDVNGTQKFIPSINGIFEVMLLGVDGMALANTSFIVTNQNMATNSTNSSLNISVQSNTLVPEPAQVEAMSYAISQIDREFLSSGKAMISSGRIPSIIDSKGIAQEQYLRKIIVTDSMGRNQLQIDHNSTNETYTAEYDFLSGPINKITIKGFRISKKSNVGVDVFESSSIKSTAGFDNKNKIIAFALNFEEPTFDIAYAERIAIGTKLYKCAAWNFTNQSCYGEWVEYMNLTPGQAYNITLYPGDPGYIETYDSNQAIDIDITALDDNTLVLAWIDGGTNYSSFEIWNTNGTKLVDQVDIDTDGNWSSRIAVDAINKTHFAIAIGDGPLNDLAFWIYDRDGNIVLTRQTADTNMGNMNDVDVCEMGDRWALINANSADSDADFRIYSNAGASLVGESNVDGTIAPTERAQNLVSCGVLNSTYWVYAYFDDSDKDISASIRNQAGTSIVGAFDIDVNAGERASVAVAGLRQNRIAVVYHNSSDGRVYLTVRTATANLPSVLYNTRIDTNNNTDSRVAIAEMDYSNESYFVAAWYARNGTSIKAAVYNSTGIQITAPFNVSLYANVNFPLLDVAGRSSTLNNGLCNATFAITYTNRTNTTVFETYWYNGSRWDGVCPDTIKPNVTLNDPTNDSQYNSSNVEFNFTVTDDRSTVLPNCTLYHNMSGSWQRNNTVINIQNNTETNITLTGINDGRYLWNIICFDNLSNNAFYAYNFTANVNAYGPNTTVPANVNDTIINQSIEVKFNVSFNDVFGVDIAMITLRYPNGSDFNYTLVTSGTEYYYVVNNTTQLGIYNITMIFTNDTYGKETINLTPGLYFTATASPPSIFDLLAPANATESRNILPNLSWQQVTEANFANYTMLIDQHPDFATPEISYANPEITNTTKQTDIALEANAVYYWRVVAYDVFDNIRNSTHDFVYITDRIPPNISLIEPYNGSYVTSAKTSFRYVPEEINTLRSCMLYGNFTGIFTVNESNMTPINNNTNWFNTTLPEGNFNWNVMCNDSAGNQNFSASNYTFTVDRTGPNVSLLWPLNNTIVNRSNNVNFTAEAIDVWANTSNCTLIINSVEQQTLEVNDGVNFTFVKFLNNGEYNWSVSCFDINGNQRQNQGYNVSVLVIDSNPPLITLNYPSDQEFLSTDIINFNYTVEDATGLTNCSIYIDDILNRTNTTILNQDHNYFNITGLAEGDHNWSVECYDNTTEFNYRRASVQLFSIDTQSPDVQLKWPAPEGQWTYDSFEKRKEIEISGSTTPQTEYVVHLVLINSTGTDSSENVHVNGTRKQDFSDIRFTNATGAPLDYFLEEYNQGINASVWVKVDRLDANENTTIYVYYSSDAAVSNSDGESTFLEFEGFESPTLDLDAGSMTLLRELNTSIAVTGSYVARRNDVSLSHSIIYQNQNQYDIRDHFVEAYLYWPLDTNSNDDLAAGLLLGGQDSGLNGYQVILDGRSAVSPQIRENTDYASRTDGTYQVSPGQWYLFRGYSDGTNLIGQVFQSGFTQNAPLATTTRVNEQTYTTGYTGLYAYSNYNQRFDNVRVRKRASPEPTIAGTGIEESKDVARILLNHNSVQFNYTPTDINLVNCTLYLNATGSFAATQTEYLPVSGALNTLEENLADGDYLWNVLCSDESGRQSFALTNITFTVDTSPPSYGTITISPSSPATYEEGQAYHFNISWQDSSSIDIVQLDTNLTGTATNISLSINGGEYNYTVNDIAAGSYYYIWYANDTASNNNSTEAYIYTVDKANPIINLTINGTEQNFNILEGANANITAELLLPGSGNIDLQVNGISINYGGPYLNNVTEFGEPGIYNITAIYAETQNYSYAQETLLVIVNDTTPPAISIIQPQNNSLIATGIISLQYNVSDSSGIDNCTLFFDGLLNQTNYTVERDIPQGFEVNVPSGNHSWYLRCTDNATNYNITHKYNFTAKSSNETLVTVYAYLPEYEKGEPATIISNTSDGFNNLVNATVTIDIIEGNTTLSWWNYSWRYRQPILLTQNVSRDRNVPITLNVTGLRGNITNCTELRLVRNDSYNHIVEPYQILVANNSDYCTIKFNAFITSAAVNQSSYYIYYGSPGASNNSTAIPVNGIFVQRGNSTGTNSQLLGSIQSVDPSKSFLLFTSSTASSAPRAWQFTGSLSSTQVQFDKYLAGTTSTIYWQVVEGEDLSVQSNTMSFAAGTSELNYTISPVNLSSSFILVSGRVNTGTNSISPEGMFRAFFYNSTLLTVRRETSTTAATASWQVVDWKNSKVQYTTATFTGTASDAQINTTDLSRSFVVMGTSVSGATSTSANFIGANITNETNVNITRVTAAGTANANIFVVELPQEYIMQRRSSTAAGVDITETITPVDETRSFHAETWTSSSNTNTYANAQAASNLTNASALVFDKNSATGTLVYYWHLISMLPAFATIETQERLVYNFTNDTGALGSLSSTWDTKNASIDYYSLVATAYRNGYDTGYGYNDFNVTPDNTPPNVTLLAPPNYVGYGAGNFEFNYTPFDYNLKNCTLYLNINGIFTPNATNTSPVNNGNNSYSNITLGPGLYDWNVLCSDTEGGSGFASANFTLNVTGPDITTNSSQIWFSNSSPIEGDNITIFANITNAGITHANDSFIVQFYRNDPDLSGIFIKNITILNLSIGEIVTINTSYIAAPGINNIFVKIDPDNRINESDESNNKANNSFTVSLYQYFYGNVSQKILLGNAMNFSIVDFINVTTIRGNIYFADADSSFSFTDLQALTRNVNGNPTANDLTDADVNLNSTGFNDSIKNVWGKGTDTPGETTSFNVSNVIIQNTPITNSTNTTSFKTGILWDTADDTGNLQYDIVNKEDLVFVTKINSSQNGGFGTNDYEIKIPGTLKDYKPGNSNLVFYVEIE